MSDRELVEELTAYARDLEDSDGCVNPFLVHEYELLTKVARRLDQLIASPSSGLRLQAPIENQTHPSR